MKRIIISLLTIFTFALVYSMDVNILMNDGSIVKGALIGKTSEEVYIQDTNNQTFSVWVNDIKSAFDADTGDQIDLNAGSASSSIQEDTVITNVVAPEPDVVVIPNTYVYYYTYDNYDCFFYGGFWWRPWHGVWYRSTFYNYGWVVINPGLVPYNVSHLPPSWRGDIVSAPRIGWGDARLHWHEWERSRYWGRVGWRREAVIRHNDRESVREIHVKEAPAREKRKAVSEKGRKREKD